jgi:hypothetical protein
MLAPEPATAYRRSPFVDTAVFDAIGLELGRQQRSS